MADCTPGGSDSQGSALKLSSRPISILCCLIDDLVEGWENVVPELYLSNGRVSCNCSPDGEADDSLFCEWGVEYTINSVFLNETGRASEYSSEFNVFSEDFGAK